MCYNSFNMIDRKEVLDDMRAIFIKMSKKSAYKCLKAILCISTAIGIIGSLLIFADPTDTDEPELTTEVLSGEAVTSDTTFSVVTTETTLPQTDEPPVPTTTEIEVTAPITTVEKEVTTTVTTTTTIITTEPVPVTTVTVTTEETTTAAPSKEPSLIVGPSKVDDDIKFSTGDAYTVATTLESVTSPSTDNKATTTDKSTGDNKKPTITSVSNSTEGNETDERVVDSRAKNSLKTLSVISAAAAIIAAVAMVLIKIFG